MRRTRSTCEQSSGRSKVTRTQLCCFALQPGKTETTALSRRGAPRHRPSFPRQLPVVVARGAFIYWLIIAPGQWRTYWRQYAKKEVFRVKRCAWPVTCSPLPPVGFPECSLRPTFKICDVNACMCVRVFLHVCVWAWRVLILYQDRSQWYVTVIGHVWDLPAAEHPDGWWLWLTLVLRLQPPRPKHTTRYANN